MNPAQEAPNRRAIAAVPYKYIEKDKPARFAKTFCLGRACIEQAVGKLKLFSASAPRSIDSRGQTSPNAIH